MTFTELRELVTTNETQQGSGDLITAAEVREVDNAIIDKVEEVSEAAAGKGGGFYLVAASDAPDLLKARADYVCDGTADQEEINEALLLGSVILTQGTFVITESILIPSNGTLSGAGKGTLITVSGMSSAFTYEIVTKTQSGDTSNTVITNIVTLNYSGLTGAFEVGEKITANNGATAWVLSDTGSVLTYAHRLGNFGPATSIEGETSEATANITSVSSEGIVVENLSVNGRIDEDNSISAIIAFHMLGSGVGDTAKRGCLIKNLFLDTTRLNGILFKDVANSIISNCNMVNCYQDNITLVGEENVYSPTNITLDANITNGGFAGLFTQYAKNLIAKGNHFSAAVDRNVQLEFSDNVILECNEVINPEGNGANVNVDILACNYLKIINNIIDTNDGNELVSIVASPGCDVIGNTIRRGQTHGLALNGCPDSMIINNRIYENGLATDNTYNGIEVNDSDRISIQGNTIRKGSLTNQQAYGINIAATTNNAMILGNNLVASGDSGDLSDNGTNTRARNNIDNSGAWLIEG